MIPVSFHALPLCQARLQGAGSQPPRSFWVVAGATEPPRSLHGASSPLRLHQRLRELCSAWGSCGRSHVSFKCISCREQRGRGGSGGGSLLPPASDPSSSDPANARDRRGMRAQRAPRGHAACVRSDGGCFNQPRGSQSPGGKRFLLSSFESSGRTPPRTSPLESGAEAGEQPCSRSVHCR